MKKKEITTKISTFPCFLMVGVLVLIFYICIARKQGIIYCTNDDIALRAIASGKYSGAPSVYMIFSGFPYSILLVTLYKITNKIDWYGVVLLSLTVFYLTYTIYSLIKNKNETLKKIIYSILILILLAFIYNKFFVELTFTCVSAFITTCCLILYLLPNSKLKNFIIMIGLVLATGIRLKSCFMILAFFVPAFFYKNYGNKEGFKRDFIFGIKIGMILLICIIIDKSFYNKANWKEYLEYNKLRSLYYDYYYTDMMSIPAETRNEIFYGAGYNNEEINLLYNYGGIGFYDDIQVKMKNLIEQCESHHLRKNANMKEILKQTFINKQFPFYIVTLIVMISFIIISKDTNRKKTTIIPFIVLQILILVYLIEGGRILDRVMVPLYTCYIWTNIYIIIQDEKFNKIINKIFSKNKFSTIGIAFLIFVISLMNIKINDIDMFLVNRGNKMLQYFDKHPKNTYIYDNNYLDRFVFFNKYYKQNYINMSGWTVYSPLYKEAINNLGTENLKDLLFKDNVYIILNSSNDAEIYKNLDENTKIEVVDFIEDSYVYKFTN